MALPFCGAGIFAPGPTCNDAAQFCIDRGGVVDGGCCVDFDDPNLYMVPCKGQPGSSVPGSPPASAGVGMQALRIAGMGAVAFGAWHLFRGKQTAPGAVIGAMGLGAIFASYKL